MMQVVPLRAIPNQTLSIILNGQSCQLNVYQTFFGLFMDVSVNNTLIIGGVLCQNLNRIVRSLYLGFSGDFIFEDTQAQSPTSALDPYYTGLGSRYVLLYLLPSDISAGLLQ